MNYNKELAAKIKKEYDFNNYEISLETLLEITEMIDCLYDGKNVLLNSFFMDLHCGKLGMFYKQPISFLSVAYKYFETRKSNHVVQ